MVDKSVKDINLLIHELRIVSQGNEFLDEVAERLEHMRDVINKMCNIFNVSIQEFERLGNHHNAN